MSDKEHLKWIRDRLVRVHAENPRIDYIEKLDNIIEKKNSTKTVYLVQREAYSDDINGPRNVMIVGYFEDEKEANKFIKESTKPGYSYMKFPIHNLGVKS
jgi:hypothetical protein